MRALVVALAVLLVGAGCGSTERGGEGRATPRAGTLEALLLARGEDVALIPGTSDYAPGTVRVSFLVVRRDGRAVLRPRARIWLARARDARPFERTTARLEPVGVPGAGDSDDVSHLYVTRVRVDRAGTYWLLAEPEGGRPIQGLGNLVVKTRSAAPAIGSKAFPSATPTIRSAGGRTSLLTTQVPPDRALLRDSVAESLAAHRPFVLVFATPKFCSSRTCGPVVDVVEAVRKRFPRSGIRFIHVEIYKRNKPSLGTNRFVREWRLPSEPWLFLVRRDGRIAERFEGSVSVRELTSAVRARLAG